MNCVTCDCPLHEPCIKDHTCERRYHRKLRAQHEHKPSSEVLLCNLDQPCRTFVLCRCGEPLPGPLESLVIPRR